ncbi:hypothetical protein SLEP1_g48916 [Rubroshorea leprosula]|uniref:Uncharacterized protein n=1 Tax=Rubroshorea leprosula TaxID=152421 RepID=A0AAV5LX95_9ROSI|nr:hypothetical protein SLEP1_g48916 [Rubroshorea leprosula]
MARIFFGLREEFQGNPSSLFLLGNSRVLFFPMF